MDEAENRFDHFVAEVLKAHALLASAIPMTRLNREILSSLALWDVQRFAIPPKGTTAFPCRKFSIPIYYILACCYLESRDFNLFDFWPD